MDVQLITDFGQPENIPPETVFSDHLSPVAVKNILKAINQSRYSAKIFGGIPELVSAYDQRSSVDMDCLYLNISNGMSQPSRRIQAPLLCELMDMKYSGSNPTAVALMNNKYFCKRAISNLVNVPKDLLIRCSDKAVDNLEALSSFPIIVKPNSEGGSIGISQKNVVFNYDDLSDRLKILLQNFEEVLVEEFISGIELTNLIIGNAGDFVLNEAVVYKTYDSFYTDKCVRDDVVKTQGLSQMYMIEDVFQDKNLVKYIKETSEKIFVQLGCRDIARVDYKLTRANELYFLEINSNPNLYTKNIDVICNKLKISYSEFLCILIGISMKRNNIDYS